MIPIFNPSTIREWRLSRAADDGRAIEASPSDPAHVRAFAGSLGALESRLRDPRGQPRVAPPMGLRLRVAESLRDTTIASSYSPLLKRRGPILAWTAAAAVMALIGTAAVLSFNSGKSSPSGSELAKSALPEFPSIPGIRERSEAAFSAAVESPLLREADAIAHDTRQAAQSLVDQLPFRIAATR
jgi:hypothetical protein